MEKSREAQRSALTQSLESPPPYEASPTTSNISSRIANVQRERVRRFVVEHVRPRVDTNIKSGISQTVLAIIPALHFMHMKGEDGPLVAIDFPGQALGSHDQTLAVPVSHEEMEFFGQPQIPNLMEQELRQDLDYPVIDAAPSLEEAARPPQKAKQGWFDFFKKESTTQNRPRPTSTFKPGVGWRIRTTSSSSSFTPGLGWQTDSQGPKSAAEGGLVVTFKPVTVRVTSSKNQVQTGQGLALRVIIG